MSDDGEPSARRGRSARYPGIPLGEAIGFCERIDSKGLDGLPASAIAQGLGYSNVRTNTFSSSLSSARQFGLLSLEGERYALTPLARSILHPIDPADTPRLLRRALLEPPLYASVAGRYASRRLPDAAPLANALYHQDQITATAKRTAAEAFLASARFAGALDSEGILRLDEAEPSTVPDPPQDPKPRAERHANDRQGDPSARVRVDLRLWKADSGKVIRIRAPESISRESYERLLAALRLHIRVEGDDEPGGVG